MAATKFTRKVRWQWRAAGWVGMALLFVFAGVWFLPGAGQSQAQETRPAKRIALLVGVNKYERRGFRDLEFAERDVEELAGVLRKAGFEVQHLTGSSPGARRATLANVTRSIDAMLKDLTKQDILLVGLAGHGFQLEVTGEDGKRHAESFFCPNDAQRGSPETMLSMGKLFNDLDLRGAGQNLVLVDACREDPTRGRGRDGSKVQGLPEGTAALFGCRSGQKTFETKAAGGGHGIFFHFVLKGLQGEAANPRTGEVTWTRLTEYVSEQVEVETPKLLDDPLAKQVPNEVRNLPGRSPLLTRVAIRGDTPSSSPLPKVGGSSPPEASDPEPTEREITNGIGMKLRLIPKGEFTMGSPESEKDRVKGETHHKVQITKAFYLGKHEVTQGEWKAVMGTEPWKGKDYVKERDDYPAVYVNWEDAVEFCKKLSRQEGKAYRLPTEAEWEYACRGGKKTRYHFGDDESELDKYAWYHNNAWANGENYAHRVGMKNANEFGLHDMHGNVSEWCQDWYDEKYYANSPVADPTGAESGTIRMLRGGSWPDSRVGARSAYRGGGTPDTRHHSIGFRVAGSVPARTR